MKQIRSVAFVGIGAVGSIYARCFAGDPLGIRCRAVVRSVACYVEDPLTINGRPLGIPVMTATEAEEPADLILISVKNHHLTRVIAEIAPLVGPETQILSLLNGITSEETLADAFGWQRVLYATCSGVDSNRSGHRVTMNRPGVLCFGEKRNETLSPRVDAVRRAFEAAALPHHIPADMERALWWKFMVNVGINQVSAVKGLRYGEIRGDPAAMALMREAQREVLRLAQASGVDLNEEDIRQWEAQLGTLSPEGRASTLQDLWQRRKTEVESYGGEVLRRGQALGIPTPVNRRLLADILELERRQGIE